MDSPPDNFCFHNHPIWSQLSKEGLHLIPSLSLPILLTLGPKHGLETGKKVFPIKIFGSFPLTSHKMFPFAIQLSRGNAFSDSNLFSP